MGHQSEHEEVELTLGGEQEPVRTINPLSPVAPSSFPHSRNSEDEKSLVNSLSGTALSRSLSGKIDLDNLRIDDSDYWRRPPPGPDGGELFVEVGVEIINVTDISTATNSAKIKLQ